MTALDDYGPYDAGLGALRTEEFWRKFFQYRTGTGVVSGVANEFAVTQHSGGDQTVDVATGECFIRGQWGQSTSLKNIALSAAHATLARIDRIVLRNDFALNTVSVEVLEGTPGATPAIPALTQDTTKWEVGLARIARAATDNVIGTADITDERTFLTFAGIEGLPIKATVRAASITNVTLASACEAGDTFGGVTLAYGDRIGLFGQTTATENGIYLVNQTGAPTRAPDADTSAKLKANSLVGVSEGTLADKWYQLTTNAPIVLGTTNQVWAEFGVSSSIYSGARVTRTTSQSLTTATLTAVQWNAETIDVGGYHDNSTNNTRLTVPTTGKYRAAWRVSIGTGAGLRFLTVKKNGTTVLAAGYTAATADGPSSLSGSDEFSLTAADYLEVYAQQNSGGSINVLGDDNELGSSAFSLSFIGT